MASKELNFYKNFEEEIEFIDLFKDVEEALSAGEVAIVANLERQKAGLMSKKVQVENDLRNLEKEIQKIDAQIASKRAAV